MKNAKKVLNIDNLNVEFTEGQTILEVALEAGIYIPTLCYMKDLTPYSGCRLCIVKVKGMKGYPTACSTPAESNMEIITNDEELKELRIEVLNLILSEHPFSCFVCENRSNCEEERGSESKAGRTFGCFSCSVRERCDLQRVINYFEIRDVNYQLEYRDSPLKRNNPFIEMDPNMCILCGKCVRICNELKNIGAINLVDRGHATKVSTAFDMPLIDTNCQFCGACIDVCPTGTFTSKNTKWFDKSSKVTTSSCCLCSMGCDFEYYSFNENLVESIPNKDNYANNKHPCLFGRFCIVPFNNGRERIKNPLIKENNNLVPYEWDIVYDVIIKNLKKFKPEEIAIIASLDLSNESAYILNKFARNILKTENIVLVSSLSPNSDEQLLERNANIQGVMENLILNNKRSQEDIIKDIESGKIKALYLTEQLTDLTYIEKIEFLILQDIYPSKSFENANVILPTCTFVEDSGSISNSRDGLNRFFQASSQVGKSKPDWLIFSELAIKFDKSKEEEFKFSTSVEIFDIINKLNRKVNTEKIKQSLKRQTRHIFEDNYSELLTNYTLLESFKYRGQKISSHVPDLKQLIEYRISKKKKGISRTEKEIPKETRFKVILNEEIALNFYKLIIESPLIAKKAKPGNFVILMKEDVSERIPLTISEWDNEKGTITLFYQETGYSTMQLTDLKAEDYIYSVVGPLGNNILIDNFGTVLLAGGCYGNGAILPIAKELKSAGNKIIVILEARNEHSFYLENVFEQIADQVVYCTSDGSKGLKGKILTGLKHVFNQNNKVDRCYFIGCTLMMRDASLFTKEQGNIPTFVSLSTIMIDGTGMCGCCRLTLIKDDKEITKFACIDGPIFNGHQIKWDDLSSRNVRFQEPEVSIYRTHSCKAIEKFEAGDINE